MEPIMDVGIEIWVISSQDCLALGESYIQITVYQPLTTK